jgi:hypothetical protein
VTATIVAPLVCSVAWHAESTNTLRRCLSTMLRENRLTQDAPRRTPMLQQPPCTAPEKNLSRVCNRGVAHRQGYD